MLESSPLSFSGLKMTLSCSSRVIPLMHKVDNRNLKTNREIFRRQQHSTYFLRLGMTKENILVHYPQVETDRPFLFVC